RPTRGRRAVVRVILRSGDRSVDIRLKGSPGATQLRHVEGVARRLFAALPAPPTDLEPLPFGFALGADTELAPDPDAPIDDDDDV
ncbi:hypothetical protein ABZ404_39140, partial [Streptomyces sp. NPDC005878]|uniref:hypothetical protein n=1 Tax=Streptomyces sp. NPDC005878 TaxID=3157077 RepID=UPI0033C7FBDD